MRGRLLPGLATLSGVPLAQTISRIFSDESVLAHNPVAQDAAYVALSARLGAPLVTADDGLAHTLVGSPFDVRWLGA